MRLAAAPRNIYRYHGNTWTSKVQSTEIFIDIGIPPIREGAEHLNIIYPCLIFRCAAPFIFVCDFAVNGLSAVNRLKVSSTGIAGATGNSISIYPNPTNGKVWITGVKAYGKLILMSNTGRILFQQTNPGQDEVKLDLSGFANGIYHIRLIGTRGTVIRKVVKD